MPSVRSFFDEWYPTLVRSLRRRLGDADLAEDIAQEAFVRLLDHQPTNPRAWLFTVAVNLVSDHTRSAAGRARRLALVDRDGARGDAPDAVLARADLVQEVHATLARLSERDRTLLLLHHGGYSYAEVAERIGVAPSSVGPLVTRAQRRFARVHVQAHVHASTPTRERDDAAQHASG